MREKFKTRTVTVRMPWLGRDAPGNRQLASYMHRFLEAGGKLLPDPGHGAGYRRSFRLECVELDLALSFSGSRTPSELLRRLIRTYHGQGASQSARVPYPTRQAEAIPQAAPGRAQRPALALSRDYPADGRRVEIAVEDVRAELAKVGYSQQPQPGSRYFRQGKRITREEGGQVVQVFEAP